MTPPVPLRDPIQRPKESVYIRDNKTSEGIPKAFRRDWSKKLCSKNMRFEGNEGKEGFFYVSRL